MAQRPQPCCPRPGGASLSPSLASSALWIWLGTASPPQGLGIRVLGQHGRATCLATTLCCQSPKQEPGTTSHLSPQAPWLGLRSPSSRSGNPRGHGGLGWERGAAIFCRCPPARPHPKGVFCSGGHQGRSCVLLGLRDTELSPQFTGSLSSRASAPWSSLLKSGVTAMPRDCPQLARHRAELVRGVETAVPWGCGRWGRCPGDPKPQMVPDSHPCFRLIFTQEVKG